MLVPENLKVLSLKHWVVRYSSIENDSYPKEASVSTFVCAGSLYTGNELEKYLIALYYAFLPLDLARLYAIGVVATLLICGLRM